MYGFFKGIVLRFMKTPTEPPELPAGSHESVQVFRASPRFLSYRLAVFWIVVTILWLGWWFLLAVALTEKELGPLVVAGVILPIMLVVQFIAYFVIRIEYDLRYYIVTDRSLRVREGAVVVKEMTITHANVQNMRVVQGPLMRLFGVWTLKVDTAGGGSSSPHEGKRDSSHSIQMAGIDNAEEVRDLILAHLRKRGHGTGLGDLDDEHEHGLVASGELLEVLREVRGACASLRAAASA